MGHQADESFFESKREWSKRKDAILEYYLTPYLAKVAKLRRPIVIVDGFAGPGVFDDGNDGSPLIIAKALSEARDRGAAVRLLAIESVPSLHERLRANLSSYEFAETRRSHFHEALPEIEQVSRSSTTFLYVDPYAICGLDWSGLDTVFRQIESNRSIELLLNFNASAFCRIARAVLKRPTVEQDDSSDDASPSSLRTLATLDTVAGGDWWRSVFTSTSEFTDEVEAIGRGVTERLRQRFAETCEMPIKEHYHHTVPKYSLIFASRSGHAIQLINEAAVMDRRTWVDQEIPPEELLFESRPEDLVPRKEALDELILDRLAGPMKRGDLARVIIRCEFGKYSTADINQAVSRLLRVRRVQAEAGKMRINDEVHLWRPKPHTQ
ncbi:MAG: three-Cys-motif partner protein TcmP [Phycisphaerales bacterium JB038]